MSLWQLLYCGVQEAGIQTSAPRDSWPLDKLRQVLETMQQTGAFGGRDVLLCLNPCVTWLLLAVLLPHLPVGYCSLLQWTASCWPASCG